MPNPRRDNGSSRPCAKCGETLPLAAFRLRSGGRYYWPYCTPCERGRLRANARRFKAAAREARAVAPLRTAHACGSVVCCGPLAAIHPAPSAASWVLFGLGGRNRELAAAGLPMLGFLRVREVGVEVYLSRRESVAFPTVRAARNWGHARKIRVIRLPEP